MELRKYQVQAKNAVLEEWGKGTKKTLLVLPTGTGKTVVFSSIAEERVKQNHRVLILAHRAELLTQAADKLKTITGLDTALEKRDSHSANTFFPITLGSVQTLQQKQRLAEFPKDYFQDIIVDEAHHCLAKSYQNIFDHFPDANILGVTATPSRGDKKILTQWFDSIAYEYSMRQAIVEKYLVPIKAQLVPLQLDISTVKMNNGDYAVNEVGSALEPYLGSIAEQMKKYCKGRKTIVFLPLISTSQLFCHILKNMGIRAAEVNSNTTNRGEILQKFGNGEYDVLCNAMLLTEGWDCPSVDCVIILRPTKIEGLYRQMVGRGTRISPGKKDLLLLDFLWMTSRHDLCKPATLIAKNSKIAEMIEKKLKKNGDALDLMDAEKEIEEEIERELKVARERHLAEELLAQQQKQAELFDPIRKELAIDEKFFKSYKFQGNKWENDNPTEKQIIALKSFGYFNAVKTKGEAAYYLDRFFKRQEQKLTTLKQIKRLKKYGFQLVDMWLKKDAEKLIAVIANNGWRVPQNINPISYIP